MAEKLRFFLGMDPMPAPRPRTRVIQPKHGGRAIATVYNPKEYTDWQAKAADDVNDQLDEKLSSLPPGFFPMEGPVTVGIVITAQKPKTSKLTAPKPDIDNYAKAVLDAMTKAGVWEDDSQVEFLAVKKQWGLSGAINVEVSSGTPI